MKNGIIVLFILGILSLSSCKETKTDLVGEWRLEKMDLAGEEIFANVLANPTYTFNQDKTYLIRASGQTETGTWKLKENKLVLFSKELDKETNIDIQTLTPESLIYKIGEDNISTVYLIK